MKCGHRKERGSEERTWHLRIPGRDCELARNDGVLPSLRIRGCAGGGERECISAEVLALVPGAFHRAARNGFWQQRRARLCSLKRSYLSAVQLWTAIVLVGGMIVFPQQIA